MMKMQWMLFLALVLTNAAWAKDVIFPSDAELKKKLTAHIVRVHPVDEHTAEVEEIQLKRDPNTAEVTKVLVVWSAQVRTDQIAAASVGVVFTQPNCKLQNVVFFKVPECSAVGFLAQAGAGLGGPKVSVGYGQVNVIGGPKFNFPLSGWDVKASALYTWNRFSTFGGQITPGDIYAGLEVDATFLMKFSLGLLRRVGGDTSSAGWVFVLGAGFGF